MICLSFDTDHVDQRRMLEFLSVAQVPGRATFFCTERYDVLNDRGHEICAHPFLEPESDWDAALAAARREFPDARGWRSHSCVYSHMLALRLAHDGYTYASTHTELGRTGLRPYREAWGLWQIPIYYMDNLDLSAQRFWPGEQAPPFARGLIDAALEQDGVHVFDFHPVHVLLNSPSADWYLEHRDALVEGAPLREVRYPGYGVHDFFGALTARMDSAGVESHALMEALHPYLEQDAIVMSQSV